MVTRQIEITEDQDKALKDLAAAQGRSVSELIRAGLDDILRTQQGDRGEVKRRALAAIGRFRSDASDLAREHDRYLDEAFGH